MTKIIWKKMRLYIAIALTTSALAFIVYNVRIYFNIDDSLFDELSYDIKDREPIVNRLLSERVEIDNSIIQELENNGFKDPVNDLRKSLYINRKLIPRKGVLGGVVDYTGEFKILSNRTVEVGFSDGHIGGKLLLKYKIINKNIEWTIIKTIMLP